MVVNGQIVKTTNVIWSHWKEAVFSQSLSKWFCCERNWSIHLELCASFRPYIPRDSYFYKSPTLMAFTGVTNAHGPILLAKSHTVLLKEWATPGLFFVYFVFSNIH